MTWSVILHKQPQDFLRKAPHDIAQRIRKKLLSIREDPFVFLERLSGEEAYKLRIGDYRALIDPVHEQQELQVHFIEHRKRVYKRFGS